MKKSLIQYISTIFLFFLPLLALAHGGEEDGGTETAIQTVADPEQLMYVAIAVGILFLALVIWFFYSRRAR